MAALLAALCAVLSMSSGQPVRARSLAEYEIKAAFMYNFAKFVQWPAEAFGQAQSPLILCVIGDDVFGPALDTIEHKLAQGRERKVRRQARLQRARPCHSVLIADAADARLGS